MRFARSFAVAVGLFVVGAAPAQRTENKLPDAVLKALEKAEAVEVYSLGGETAEKDGWHGAKVLGSTTVKDATAVKALVAEVKKGVTDGDGGARCFVPRHGARAIYDGKTYDFLICFECHWVYVFIDGSDKPIVRMIAESPQKAFNKVLTNADVPLAKPMK